MKRVLTHPVFAASVLLMVIAMAFTALAARAAYPTGQEFQERRMPDMVQGPVRFSVSPPLRDMQPIQPQYDPTLTFPEHRYDTGPGIEGFVDEAVQTLTGPLAIPTPAQNFEGMYNIWGGYPPDTAGDVGPNHYVQIVNVGFQVFSKTGVSLYGPANNNTIYAGAGGFCESTNRGDPIALYDEMADRFLVSWFAFTSQSGPTYQCVAVTAGPDPLGPWYRYEFLTGQTTFVDYPHLGVWPDGYYMAANLFGSPGGGGVYAFERERMLVGDPNAQIVAFLGVASALLPSDQDGQPPPAGSPNYFLRFSGGSNLALHEFHVDWVTPGNSTFSAATNIPVTAFSTGVGGIPQPNTAVLLANLADRLMYRVVYRNMGTHEVLLASHTVDSGGSVAGVRWYELRDPNGAPTVFQQGTHTLGDGVERWMGSIGMDRMGNIAIGYSASSSSVHPSIRYAGRLSTDPLGQMSQGEASIIAGTGSQTGPGARWGDYSQMAVDPADGCTFWYTQEYIQVTGERTWRTRVASFKFAECVAMPGTPAPTVTAPVPTVTPVPTMIPACDTHTGSLASGDLTQTSRIITVGLPPSTCAIPRVCPGDDTSVTTQHYYDEYTYANTGGAAVCVTVDLIAGCSNNALTSVAYNGSYDPASKCTNYIADGARGGPNNHYSFSLPAGQTAVIIVFEHSGGIGCETYTLNVTSALCASGTPQPTNTSGPPTSTPTLGTPVSTNTPLPTATPVCEGTTYQTSASTGATMLPATNDIGNHCDDCATDITLPFPVTVYGTSYLTASVGSNSAMQFQSANPKPFYFGQCVPVTPSQGEPFLSTLFPYYADLQTDIEPGSHGIYTDVTGTPPNRQFVIRWNTVYFAEDPPGDVSFEVVLTENSPVLSVIYGTTDQTVESSSGIQLNLDQYTVYSCNTGIPDGTRVDYVPIECGATPTPTAGAATATPTSCPVHFEDVPSGHTFYTFIRCLACQGIINGYPCGGTGEPCNPPSNNPYFRPGNFVTRGQLSKIVAISAGYNTPVSGQTFEDVQPGTAFYTYTEQLAGDGVIGGYPCGQLDSEPCIPPDNRPYFRPGNSTTRGQLTKIVALAAGFTDPAPATFTFTDVPVGHTFHIYVEALLLNRPGVMEGYPCGVEPGEPCDDQNRPYFRPNNTLTRGQGSKIVANTFFPGCNPTGR